MATRDMDMETQDMDMDMDMASWDIGRLDMVSQSMANQDMKTTIPTMDIKDTTARN
jgi:hypothetical protein